MKSNHLPEGLVEVVDTMPDAYYQDLQRIIDQSHPEKEPGNWQSLKRDFSSTPWKPFITYSPKAKFPYEAFAVHINTGYCDKEGVYRSIDEAKVGAIDLTVMNNLNLVAPPDLKKVYAATF